MKRDKVEPGLLSSYGPLPDKNETTFISQKILQLLSSEYGFKRFIEHYILFLMYILHSDPQRFSGTGVVLNKAHVH